jgi:hypothetical protein
MAIDDATRIFSISPITDEFHNYVTGQKLDFDSPQSIQFADIEGNHWVYFDGTGIKTIHEASLSQKIDIVTKQAFVTYFYWDAVNKKVVFDLYDERHGISMSPDTHEYLHITRGAQFGSGYGLGNFVIGDGSLDTHAQFSIEAGTIYDEDLRHDFDGSIVGDTIDVMYLLGDSLLRDGSQSGFSFLNATNGRVYYNLNTNGVWSLEEVPTGDYVLYHIFAINGYNKQVVSVMGQSVYPNRNEAREAASTEIRSIKAGFELAEAVPVATYILQTSDGYGNSVKARVINNADGTNYVDWRSTELSGGVNPSDHANLVNVLRAGTGVSRGHVDNAYPLQLPELTTAQRDLISANEGMKIFNTTDGEEQIYKGGQWVASGGGGGASYRAINNTPIPVLGASTTNIPVANSVVTYAIANGALTLAFTASGGDGTEEITTKAILDNSANSEAVTVAWSDANLNWNWDDSGVPSSLAAGAKYVLEIEVESATEVFAMLIPKG